jgi:hypothetical protein
LPRGGCGWESSHPPETPTHGLGHPARGFFFESHCPPPLPVHHLQFFL